MNLNYDFAGAGVRFKGSGAWPYAVHYRQHGHQRTEVFRWRELWNYSQLPTAEYAYKRACELMPNSHVYLIDRNAEVVLQQRRPQWEDSTLPTSVRHR